MANQMIALGVRGPQLPDLGANTSRMAQMANMMMQQRAAERQAAQAQQTMDIQAAQESRAAALAPYQQNKAQYEGQSARLKFVTDFLDTSAVALSNVRNAQEAVGVSEILKKHFPDMADAIDQTMSSIPANPAEFDAWRQRTRYQTMDAKDQLEQKFVTQNLGTSTRQIAMPKYAGGAPMAATTVPGSAAPVSFKPTVVNVEGIGAMVVDPNTNTAYPAATGPTGGLVGGVRGGGGSASALQTNPGAIKDGAFARSQPGYAGAAGGFATFATPQHGVAAQENLLRSAYIGKGINTIDAVINRYAPVGPENTPEQVANYKAYVARQAGIKPGAVITDAQIPAVARAMREFETGARAAAPQTTEQASSQATRSKQAKAFQTITGVNLQTGADPVEALISGSTSGSAEQLGANIMGALPSSMGGGATPGMQNIGKLGVLKSTLMLELMPGGRLSTGVSDEDRKAIERMVGDIDNPSVPAAQRLASWRMVKQVMSRKIGLETPPPPNGTKKNTSSAVPKSKYQGMSADAVRRRLLGGR